MKYRKKPVVIEAILWDETADTFEQLIKMGFEIVGGGIRVTDDVVEDLHIKTPEGILTAKRGDFIIKGIFGEFYPCKPDIFEKTYEKVEE